MFWPKNTVFVKIFGSQIKFCAYVIYEWPQSDIPFHNEPSGGTRDNCAIQFYLKSGKGAAWTDSPCNSARCFTICELE